jgi:hypothetical protein
MTIYLQDKTNKSVAYLANGDKYSSAPLMALVTFCINHHKDFRGSIVSLSYAGVTFQSGAHITITDLDSMTVVRNYADMLGLEKIASGLWVNNRIMSDVLPMSYNERIKWDKFNVSSMIDIRLNNSDDGLYLIHRVQLNQASKSKQDLSTAGWLMADGEFISNNGNSHSVVASRITGIDDYDGCYDAMYAMGALHLEGAYYGGDMLEDRLHGHSTILVENYDIKTITLEQMTVLKNCGYACDIRLNGIEMSV